MKGTYLCVALICSAICCAFSTRALTRYTTFRTPKSPRASAERCSSLLAVKSYQTLAG